MILKINTSDVVVAIDQVYLLYYIVCVIGMMNSYQMPQQQPNMTAQQAYYPQGMMANPQQGMMASPQQGMIGMQQPQMMGNPQQGMLGNPQQGMMGMPQQGYYNQQQQMFASQVGLCNYVLYTLCYRSPMENSTRNS